MPRKQVGTTGWTREIIAVHTDKDGVRMEKDFDLCTNEEKDRIRERNTKVAMGVAGYEPVERRNAGR